MVEVLSTSFQNLYKKYARPENAAVQGGGRDEVYIAPVNTARNDADNDYQEQQQQQQQLRYGSKSRKPFAFDVRRLCAVKTDKWNVLTVNTRRPLVGKCCSVCIPVRFWILLYFFLRIFYIFTLRVHGVCVIFAFFFSSTS